MIQEARELLMRSLRGDAGIFTATKGRVYPQDIATMDNPRYPCMTFRVDAGTPDANIPDVGVTRFIINFYSAVNYNESYAMYELVKDFLALARLKNANVVLWFKEVGLPRELYDPIATSYNVITSWSATIIEL